MTLLELLSDGSDVRAALGWMEQAAYDGMGRLEEADFEFELRIGDNVFDAWVRDYMDDYDELGIMTSSEIETSELATVITRAFSYNLDWSAGTQSYVGPDGVEMFVEFDDASRVEFVRRGPAGAAILMAKNLRKA